MVIDSPMNRSKEAKAGWTPEENCRKGLNGRLQEDVSASLNGVDLLDPVQRASFFNVLNGLWKPTETNEKMPERDLFIKQCF